MTRGEISAFLVVGTLGRVEGVRECCLECLSDELVAVSTRC